MLGTCLLGNRVLRNISQQKLNFISHIYISTILVHKLWSLYQWTSLNILADHVTLWDGGGVC